MKDILMTPQAVVHYSVLTIVTNLLQMSEFGKAQLCLCSQESSNPSWRTKTALYMLCYDKNFVVLLTKTYVAITENGN